jgi:DNA-directed RNA polymerase subunit beta'
MTKKEVTNVIDYVYRHCGQKDTVIFCDQLMAMGFKHACTAGISFGISDLETPKAKTELMTKAEKQVKDFEQQYQDGLITRGEKYNKVVDVWSKCSDDVASEMMKNISTTKKILIKLIITLCFVNKTGSLANVRIEMAGEVQYIFYNDFKRLYREGHTNFK